MKKAFLPIALAVITALVLVVSCQKSYSPIPPSAGAVNLTQLFSAIQPVPQSFSVPAGKETVIYAAQGTKMHFYSNSFKDANGNIITSGTVNIQMTEMYKPGDMIANRATTIANGEILQSGGQVNITATQNGNPVYANKYSLAFRHNSTSSAPMAMFYGATGNNAAATTTWTQSDTTQNGTKAAGTTSDSAANNASSLFVFDSCTNFTWANCDWFNKNDSPKTTVSIILPDSTFNPTNTQMYLVLPNITRAHNTRDTFNAVLSSIEPRLGSESYNASTNTMKLISQHNNVIVPAGLDYELVVMANKNGIWYYYQQQGVIPHNGLLVNVALVQTTEQRVITQLAGL